MADWKSWLIDIGKTHMAIIYGYHFVAVLHTTRLKLIDIGKTHMAIKSGMQITICFLGG